MDRETKSQTAPRGSLIFEYDRVDFHRAENISNRNISVGFYASRRPLSPVFEVFALVRWPNEYRLPVRKICRAPPRPRLIVHPLTG